MSNSTFRDAQLCQLLAEELELVLLNAEDPLLSELYISEVQARSGGSAFSVLLEPRDYGALQVPQHTLKQTIQRASGFLRRELTEALNLRRSPQITFSLDPRYALAVRRT
jgi:ribosome-binding factor A